MIINRQYIYLLISFILSVILGVLSYFSEIEGGQLHYSVYLLALCFCLLNITISYKIHSFTLFFFVYKHLYFFLLLIACYLTTYSLYFIETQKYSNPNGVFWVVFLFYCYGSFIVTSYANFFIKKNYKKINNNNNSRKIFLWGVYVILFLGVVHFFINYDSPILSGIGRNKLWSNIPMPFSYYPNFLILSFFIVFFTVFTSEVVKKSYVIFGCLVYLLIGFFVLGQKYSLYITLISSLCVILVRYKIPLRKIFFGMSLLLSGLLVLVLFVYSTEGLNGSFFIDRLHLQAQVNWLILDGQADSFKVDNVAYDEIRDSIDELILPHNVYQSYSKNNIQLTGYFPGYLFIIFDIIGAIVIYGMLVLFLCVLSHVLLKSVFEAKLIPSFLSFKLLSMGLLIIYGGQLNLIKGFMVVFVFYLLVLFIKNYSKCKTLVF